MQAVWQPCMANTRHSSCCGICLRAGAPFSRVTSKGSLRGVTARSRPVAVSADGQAQSRSPGSPKALKEQDMPQIRRRSLRSQKSVDQGQSEAQPQQRSSPQLQPEAHAFSKSCHRPASSSHSMPDGRRQPPRSKRPVAAGTILACKAAMSHSSGGSSRDRLLGHAGLQRYWSALQKGVLQGETHLAPCMAVSPFSKPLATSQPHARALHACMHLSCSTLQAVL